MQKGILTVLSGFSGAGKGTAMKRLMEKYEDYALSHFSHYEKTERGRSGRKRIFFQRNRRI